MAKHVAFLRAINVGGRVVKMDALRAHCEACGLSNVETFIASGNVIFDSRAAAATLETTIERALKQALGYEVATFIRSPAELGAIVATAAKQRGKAKRVYVGFLKAAPPADAQQKVRALRTPGERLLFTGREVYWFTDGGVSESKFSYRILEKITGSSATFRNITTVTKLAERARS